MTNRDDLNPAVRASRWATALLTLALFPVMHSAAQAQLQIALDYVETLDKAHCGSAIAAVGDIDGDGVADLLVGLPGIASTSGPKARVRLLSGADGSQIYTLTQFSKLDSFGAAVAATDDLDGDGVPDFAVGAPKADFYRKGEVYVYSGASGNLIFSFLGSATDDHFGTAVVAIGDVNGDGVPDILASAPDADHLVTGGGRARVLSGANGAVLMVHDGNVVQQRLGSSLAAMDDVDGDGVRDYAIASPFAPNLSGSGIGVVRVHSGATGMFLYEISNTTSAPFATSIARIGDLDADGLDDLLIANYLDTGIFQAQGYRGVIRAFSGANGTLLYEINGILDNERLGQGISSISDLNGDGIDEILATTYWASGVSLIRDNGLRVFSGANGDVLTSLDASYATVVCSVPDLNGDGLDDIALGRPGSYNSSNDEGRVTVYLSQPLTNPGLGGGQANSSIAALFVNGAHTYGNAGPFIASHSAGSQLVLDVIGLPLAFFDLYTSPVLSPGSSIFPGFGSLDIGTPPAYTDLYAAVQGLTGSQTGYVCDFHGAARVTMMIPNGWPVGLLGCVQALIQVPQPTAGVAWARLSAAHQIIVQ